MAGGRTNLGFSISFEVVDRASRDIANLAKQLTQLAQSLQALSTTMKNLKGQGIDFSKTLKSTVSNSKQVKKSLKEMSDASEVFRKDVVRSGQTLGHFWQTAIHSIDLFKMNWIKTFTQDLVFALKIGLRFITSYQILRVFRNALQDLQEFSKWIARSATLMGSNWAQAAGRLQRELIALGGSFGKLQAMGEALYFALSSGAVNATNALQFFTIIAKGAVGGVASLKEAVDVTTTILNAYGLETSKTSEVMDKLLATVQFGKTTLGELGRTMGTVVPTAALLNVNLNTLGAAIAVLTGTGQSAAKVTVGLNSVLRSLLAPTRQMQAAALALGIEWSGQRVQVEGLVPLLRDLREVYNRLARERGILVAQRELRRLLGTQEALRTILPIITTGWEKFNRLIVEHADAIGKTEEMYRRAMDSFGAQLSRFVENVKRTFIIIAAPATTVLRNIFQFMSDFLEDFNRLILSFTETFINGFRLLGQHVEGATGIFTKFGEILSSVGKGLKDISFTVVETIAIYKVLTLVISTIGTAANNLVLTFRAAQAEMAATAAATEATSLAFIKFNRIGTGIKAFFTSFIKNINLVVFALTGLAITVQKVFSEIEKAQKKAMDEIVNGPSGFVTYREQLEKMGNVNVMKNLESVTNLFNRHGIALKAATVASMNYNDVVKLRTFLLRIERGEIQNADIVMNIFNKRLEENIEIVRAQGLLTDEVKIRSKALAMTVQELGDILKVTAQRQSEWIDYLGISGQQLDELVLRLTNASDNAVKWQLAIRDNQGTLLRLADTMRLIQKDQEAWLEFQEELIARFGKEGAEAFIRAAFGIKQFSIEQRALNRSAARGVQLLTEYNAVVKQYGRNSQEVTDFIRKHYPALKTFVNLYEAGAFKGMKFDESVRDLTDAVHKYEAETQMASQATRALNVTWLQATETVQQVIQAYEEIRGQVKDASELQALQQTTIDKLYNTWKELPKQIRYNKKTLEEYQKAAEKVIDTDKDRIQVNFQLREAIEKFNLRDYVQDLYELERAIKVISNSELDQATKILYINQLREKELQLVRELAEALGVRGLTESFGKLGIALRPILGEMPEFFDWLAQIQDETQRTQETQDELTLSWTESFRALSRLVGADGLGNLFSALINLQQATRGSNESFGRLIKTNRRVIRSIIEIALAASEVIRSFGQMVGAIEQGEEKIVAAFESIGASIGAAIGAVFKAPEAGAAIGKIIGSILGTITSAFSHPRWKRVMRSIGREWGIQITEALAKEIAELAEQLAKQKGIPKGTATWAAQLMKTADILRQMTVQNLADLERMGKRVRDIFAGVQSGVLTTAEATEALDEAFQVLIEQVEKFGDVGNVQVRQIITDMRNMGMEIPSVMEFINKQIDQMASGFQKLADYVLSFDDASQISERDLRLLGATALAVFNEAMKNGASLTEAMEKVADPLKALREKFNELGIEAPRALKQMFRMQRLTEQNKDLLASVEGLNQALSAMANIGILDKKTWDDALSFVNDRFQDLIKNGFKQKEALAAIAPVLNNIVMIAKNYGFELDENTKKLVEMARQQGLLGKEQMSVVDVLIEGFSRIIELLGGRIPEAWQRATQAARETQNGIIEIGRAIDDQMIGNLNIAYNQMKNIRAEEMGIKDTLTTQVVDGLTTVINKTQTWHDVLRSVDQTAREIANTFDNTGGTGGGGGGGRGRRMQTGGSFHVSSPTSIVVGEAGREFVTVIRNPRSVGPEQVMGPINLTLNVFAQSVDEEFIRTRLMPLLREELSRISQRGYAQVHASTLTDRRF